MINDHTGVGLQNYFFGCPVLLRFGMPENCVLAPKPPTFGFNSQISHCLVLLWLVINGHTGVGLQNYFFG